MRVIQLVDEAALAAWLAARGIDVDAWGRGGAKTAADLWQEARRGECVLLETAVAPGCLRRVRLVEVIIRRGERVLLELAQELADGRRRERLIPPSEKMQPGEDTAVAAMRGLWEELHLAAADVTLLDAGAAPRRRRLDSPSYPGLPTEYLIYPVAADAPGLPAADFWLEDRASGDGNPVRRQLWGWRER